MTSKVHVSMLFLLMARMAASRGCFGTDDAGVSWFVGECKANCDGYGDVLLTAADGESFDCPDALPACCKDFMAPVRVCRLDQEEDPSGGFLVGRCEGTCSAIADSATAKSGFGCDAIQECCEETGTGELCGESDGTDVKLGYCTTIGEYCAPGFTGTTNHATDLNCGSQHACCIRPDAKPACVYEENSTYLEGACVKSLLCSEEQTAETNHGCATGNVCCAEGDVVDASDACFPARPRS